VIIAYEPSWAGTVHAPANSAALQIVARAFPDQPIRMLADPSHLEELRRDASLAACRTVSFAPAPLSRHFRSRTGIVSFRRFLRELATLAAALWRVPAGQPVLLLLLSATPTVIFAAATLARLRGGACGVQVMLHGNLNDAAGWRPRNPLPRSFDLKAALEARHGGRLRFLVLEDCIHRELLRLSPSGAARTDVLTPPPPPPPPLRVGFVGAAIADKGIDTFLDIARDFRARHGDRVAFHLVGNARPGADPARFAPLAEPIEFKHLSRAVFTARLAALHYVMLPFRPGYYTLSPSGGLLDAITWLKPVLATPTPIVTDMFAEYGEIGVLCDDSDGLRAALAAALEEGLGPRYAARVAAMRRLRDSREPEALARRYRTILSQHFAGLLPQ
jgi:glycosyltransferase involved in cell wall biosynthesis